MTNRMWISNVILLQFCLICFNNVIDAFTVAPKCTGNSIFNEVNHNGQKFLAEKQSKFSLFASSVSSSTNIEEEKEQLKIDVETLKKVLEKEYVTFFDPMVREYYSPDVSFEDPMTSLAGVDAYQNNVDLLSGRTLLGKILFEDGGIALHKITGGDIISNTDNVMSISNIITRWTLRVTVKLLPWKPTARFTGISVYEVEVGGPKNVQIKKQIDYWDSINIQKGGTYAKVAKGIAVSDFINQLKSENFNAPSVGPELPYELLRRGNGYDVRRFPTYLAIKLQYDRRDEAYNTLGSFARGTDPLAPSIIDVEKDGSKYMAWPLTYSVDANASIESLIKQLPDTIQEKIKDSTYKGVEVVQIPSKTVAIRTFSDACVEPVVRREDAKLKEALLHDGITISTNELDGKLKFAQYDAIFTMGKRRSEVWIDLEDNIHPW